MHGNPQAADSAGKNLPLIAASPTTVLVVRHAEVHNPRDILYGRLPRFRLSARGKEQAHQTARFISTRPLTALYSSPLLRARQTARILLEYQPKLRMHTAHDLIEVGTSYQGSPNSILKPGFSFYDPVRDESDETMAQVRDRMLSVLRRLIRRHVGQVFAVVSHADPIAILRLGLEGRELNNANLHSTVYPARASVLQIALEPDREISLSYFDIVGKGA